jgi:hypothetical protein
MSSHSPRTGVARAGPCTCRRAFSTHAAGILAAAAYSPRDHLAGAAHVYAGGRAETFGGPLCRPLPGGGHRGEDLHHPGGPMAGDYLRGPPEGPQHGSSPASPVTAASRGRLPKKLATSSI